MVTGYQFLVIGFDWLAAVPFIVFRLTRCSKRQPELLPYKFFFAQAPTRSSAFSMFSIELATLKRK